MAYRLRSSRCVYRPLLALAVTSLAGMASTSRADAPVRNVVQNPSFDPNPPTVVIEVSKRNRTSPPAAANTFGELDAFMRDELPEPPADPNREGLPEHLTQIGGMVVPKAMLEGAQMVPDASGFDDFARPTGPRANETPNWGPEHCDYPDEVPPGIYDYDPRPGMERPRFGTIFLNFNGGVLYSSHPDANKHIGGENSAENVSSIARSGHMFPAYAGGEARAIAVAQAVQADFEDWAIQVVYLERPPKILPYTMVMVGGHHSDTTAGASGGVAPLDCEDFGQRNVCYAFQNLQPTTTQANVVSQEIGHTYGLGHTRAPDSVMAFGYAPTQGGDLGFNDSCADTVQVANQGASCIGVNKCHCGVPTQQHDKRTLSMIFAPAGVDLVAPTIDIITPADGEVFDVGAEVVVELDPWDDVGGFGWKLSIEDEDGELLAEQVDYMRALSFPVQLFDPGTYVIRAEIQDHAGHVDMDQVTIEVRGPTSDDGESATDSGVDDETGGIETGDPLDTDDMDADSGSDTAGLADDDGCGCNVPSRRGPLAASLSLLALAALRRRRPFT